jgi:hypothetical protein
VWGLGDEKAGEVFRRRKGDEVNAYVKNEINMLCIRGIASAASSNMVIYLECVVFVRDTPGRTGSLEPLVTVDLRPGFEVTVPPVLVLGVPVATAAF